MSTMARLGAHERRGRARGRRRRLVDNSGRLRFDADRIKTIVMARLLTLGAAVHSKNKCQGLERTVARDRNWFNAFATLSKRLHLTQRARLSLVLVFSRGEDTMLSGRALATLDRIFSP